MIWSNGVMAAFGGPERDSMLIVARWPEGPESWIDQEAEAEIGWLVEVVSGVRSLRAEVNVPASARPDLTVTGADETTRARLDRHASAIRTLARTGRIETAETAPSGSAPFVAGEATYGLSVAEHIDVPAETARLEKEIAGVDGELEKTRRKLDNPDFVNRAKPEVVEENRQRLVDGEATRAKLTAALARLKAVG